MARIHNEQRHGPEYFIVWSSLWPDDPWYIVGPFTSRDAADAYVHTTLKTLYGAPFHPLGEPVDGIDIHFDATYVILSASEMDINLFKSALQRMLQTPPDEFPRSQIWISKVRNERLRRKAVAPVLIGELPDDWRFDQFESPEREEIAIDNLTWDHVK